MCTFSEPLWIRDAIFEIFETFDLWKIFEMFETFEIFETFLKYFLVGGKDLGRGDGEESRG